MKPILIISFIVIFILGACDIASAQSTLEYATLISATAGAAAKQTKGKSQQGQGEGAGQASGNTIASTAEGLYDQGSAALSRGGALLGQVGKGVATPALPPPPENVSAGNAATEKTGQEEKSEAAGTDEGRKVKVHLRGGQVVEGVLVQEAKDQIQVDCEGIVLTYFAEEIEKIEVGS